VRAVWGIEVPVIAAVNGPAIGLGNDVACLCDTRLAAETAIFGATFLKIGLIPGDGGAWLLPRIIGMARASELLYTGDTIDAHTAKAWGLVSEVVPDAELMPRARTLARKISVQAPDVLRMTKQLLRQGMLSSFDNIMELSASMQAIAHHTADHREALDAFMLCTKTEGIIPALESAHGLAHVLKLAPTMGRDETIVLCLSGRGDKDVESVGQHLGMAF